MLSRWILDIDINSPLNDEEILNKADNVWIDSSTGQDLKRLIKFDPIITDSSDQPVLLSGTFYYHWNQFYKYYDISNDGNIGERDDSYINTSVIPFWISFPQKYFALPSITKLSARNAVPILSNGIFGNDSSLKKIEYKIENIHEACCRGMYSLWHYKFDERQGSISKGNHYGEDINVNDVLFQETQSTKKNSIGIKIPFNNQDIKTRITRKGSITLFLDDDFGYMTDFFAFVGSLEQYKSR